MSPFRSPEQCLAGAVEMRWEGGVRKAWPMGAASILLLHSAELTEGMRARKWGCRGVVYMMGLGSQQWPYACWAG